MFGNTFVYLSRLFDQKLRGCYGVFSNIHLQAESNNCGSFNNRRVFSRVSLTFTNNINCPIQNKMLPISLSGLHLVKTFAVIIFLPNRCFAQEVDPVPPNNIAINGAYITLYQYASRGLKIGRHTCPSLLQCAHLCVKSPNCYSFNYQVSAPRNALCELSNESITSSEEQETLKKMPGFVFVQIMRKDLVSFRFVLIFVSFFFLSICLFNIKD